MCSQVLILRQGKVVAHDRIENLRTLMQQESLEGVFAQLTQQEDPDKRARSILEAVQV
jgi:ABC-type Na+ transport system ATPase subunit NatA